MKVGDGGQHRNATLMHAGHAGERMSGGQHDGGEEGCLSPRRPVESIGLHLLLPLLPDKA